MHIEPDPAARMGARLVPDCPLADECPLADPRAGLGPPHPEDPDPGSRPPGPECHRLTVVVALAITPAGLASYARRNGFGATPAEHAKALEHLRRQLPGYVDTGLYRVPELEPAIWAVTVQSTA